MLNEKWMFFDTVTPKLWNKWKQLILDQKFENDEKGDDNFKEYCLWFFDLMNQEACSRSTTPH